MIWRSRLSEPGTADSASGEAGPDVVGPAGSCTAPVIVSRTWWTASGATTRPGAGVCPL